MGLGFWACLLWDKERHFLFVIMWQNWGQKLPLDTMVEAEWVMFVRVTSTEITDTCSCKLALFLPRSVFLISLSFFGSLETLCQSNALLWDLSWAQFWSSLSFWVNRASRATLDASPHAPLFEKQGVTVWCRFRFLHLSARSNIQTIYIASHDTRGNQIIWKSKVTSVRKNN